MFFKKGKGVEYFSKRGKGGGHQSLVDLINMLSVLCTWLIQFSCMIVVDLTMITSLFDFFFHLIFGCPHSQCLFSLYSHGLQVALLVFFFLFSNLFFFFFFIEKILNNHQFNKFSCMSYFEDSKCDNCTNSTDDSRLGKFLAISHPNNLVKCCMSDYQDCI